MRLPALAAILSIALSITGVIAALPAPAAAQSSAANAPRVRVDTSLGSFVIQLDAERAPLTVANFLQYVREGHYQGTIFHRVIGNFIAQAGGYDRNFVAKPRRPTIPNESGNGLSNRRGTVGLARTAAPHGGDAEFFINLADNAPLDPQPSRWGYVVFGLIVDGMRVVDEIGAVATGAGGPFESDVPLKPIVIENIEELR
ncbi:peptidyl-prolyl cis-trans isomerase B [Steroidobacter denitrificans]|uniref:Peptidyl-prolyl cis-trans isomerase n=1 Tax=Steroidobacter denitrificans TaxID=465721 RepID=A0A127FAN8_STEDE|nr:peptidylprolyl isomerase [Steroidobacter denitrificans]AMN47487.1 peptidyl-prolyl cis-trans isomerase B [Steroidobacter denitrificans]